MQDKPRRPEILPGKGSAPEREQDPWGLDTPGQDPVWKRVELPQGGPAAEGGEAFIAEGVFPPSVCRSSFAELAASLAWEERDIQIFGRRVPQPRLVAFYGDSGACYRYSGTLYRPRPWTRELARIRTRVEELVGTSFNAVLCNLYRSEKDSMGWHSDDEPEMGRRPVIASVSLGATRSFRIRPREGRSGRRSVGLALRDGSLLLMKGALQENYQHQVPKVTAAAGVGPRINLTFRSIDWIRTPGQKSGS